MIAALATGLASQIQSAGIASSLTSLLTGAPTAPSAAGIPTGQATRATTQQTGRPQHGHAHHAPLSDQTQSSLLQLQSDTPTIQADDTTATTANLG